MAEALSRAQRRRAAEGRGIALSSDVSRKWSQWYGAAQARSALTDVGIDAPLTTGEPVAGMSEEIVTYYAPASLNSEQYRSLRTRLISANRGHEHRLIAVSSALPREGKSVTTVNLAFSLAEIPHLKTLIVDGDMRQCRLAKLLNVASAPGLAELLDGRATYDEVLRPTPAPNLFFIAAGRTNGRSATELLSRKSARATFERFGREFHYTIIDTPPATTVADVGIIGQMTSGVLFVIRMHRTPEPLARRAIKHIQSNNIPVIGGLVIGEDDPTRGYGRRYSYYKEYKDRTS